MKKNKELTQEEMDFILGGEIQEFSVAGATHDVNNHNKSEKCSCFYNNSNSVINNTNDITPCYCVCSSL